ncbi:hypothetical protein D3C78_1610180 [compost metagenome]
MRHVWTGYEAPVLDATKQRGGLDSSPYECCPYGAAACGNHDVEFLLRFRRRKGGDEPGIDDALADFAGEGKGVFQPGEIRIAMDEYRIEMFLHQ